MNSFGELIKVTFYGTSHGKVVALGIDNIPSGIKLNIDLIQEKVSSRRGDESLTTERKEQDKLVIESGIFNGFTDGTPLLIKINNYDCDDKVYQQKIIRPSHADLTSYEKYRGFNNYLGGGMFSGRMSVLFIILGEISRQILNFYNLNILITSHIKSLKDIEDRNFDNYLNDYHDLENKALKVLDSKALIDMTALINKTKESGDSLGGVVETIIINPLKNLGEPYFDSFESLLSHLLFSLGGVKGVIFGDFDSAYKLLGSEANDQIQYLDGSIKYLSNHNGGINGGITNGETIIFKTYIKPTPSINKEQKTIDIEKEENTIVKIKGRHDPAIAIRFPVIINAISQYLLLELYLRNKVIR